MKGNLKQCLYQIPSSTIKRVTPYISQPLLHCFHLCKNKNRFPAILKIAIIAPLSKSGDPTDPSNRRPISSLSFFSKLFKHYLHGHLVNFLESNKIFHPLQFGFRKHNSTARALAYLQNVVTSSVDRKLIPIAVFLDIAKAFDSVEHKILTHKMEHYGIRGSALELFASYLADRKHSTFVNGVVSSLETCNFGVPQGSIMAPTLFLLFINDVYFLPLLSTLFSYEDDSTLLISAPTIQDAIIGINQDVAKLND